MIPSIEAKNVNNQIATLKSRGMIFSDVKKAQDIIKRKNYYNVINAFKDIFESSKDVFISGITFENIYSMYCFDVKIRNLFLEYILKVEYEFKSKLSLSITKYFDLAPYFNDKLYNLSIKRNIQQIKDMKERITKILKSDEHCFISHFVENGVMPPTWALFNSFEFGTMRIFYTILNDRVKNNLCSRYGINDTKIISMLSSLNMYRNICAHSNRLYSFKIKDHDKAVSNTNIHANLHINTVTGEYKYGKNDLFSIVICFKYLLTDSDFKSFFHRLENAINHLKNNIPAIPFSRVIESMGFPTLDLSTGQKSWTDILTVCK